MHSFFSIYVLHDFLTQKEDYKWKANRKLSSCNSLHPSIKHQLILYLYDILFYTYLLLLCLTQLTFSCFHVRLFLFFIFNVVFCKISFDIHLLDNLHVCQILHVKEQERSDVKGILMKNQP